MSNNEQAGAAKESGAIAIVWRNPLNSVQEQLREKEAGDPYYGWAEHSSRIRSYQSRRDANRR